MKRIMIIILLLLVSVAAYSRDTQKILRGEWKVIHIWDGDSWHGEGVFSNRSFEFNQIEKDNSGEHKGKYFYRCVYMDYGIGISVPIIPEILLFRMHIINKDEIFLTNIDNENHTIKLIKKR